MGWWFSWTRLFSVAGGHDRTESTVSFVNEWSSLYDSDASAGSDVDARRYAPIDSFSLLPQKRPAHGSHVSHAWFARLDGATSNMQRLFIFRHWGSVAM